MQPTIAVPHATSCCIPPPHKLLIFKDFSESLSYIYIKAKIISKIVALIKKTKCVKNDKRFNFYTKQPPISPVGRNGGINGATRLDAPHGAGGVPPPLSCASPPPSGRFPPLVCIRRVGLRFFIQLGQAREAGASGPEGKGARGACAQLWNPRPAGGGCPHLYGVGSKVVHTRARVFL